MTVESSSPSSEDNKSRKKGGIRKSFQALISGASEYWEVMLVYVQKNLQEILKNILWATLRVFLSLFFILYGLGYLSYALFLFFQKSITGGDPLLASALVGSLFVLIAALLLVPRSKN